MKIKVKVKPNAGEQSVEKISPELYSENGFEGLYFVKLKSFAREGEANLELIKLLTKYFNTQGCTPKDFQGKSLLRAREVRIKSGFTSRNKIVEIG